MSDVNDGGRLPETVPYQILMSPGASVPNLNSPAVAAAAGLQYELLGGDGADEGIRAPNAFLPRTRHRGYCRACGEFTEMSFEHVPPAATGNRSRARGVSALDILTSPDPADFPSSGWFASQRGVGAYVLCKPCNEIFGDKYVRPYVSFSRRIGLGSIAFIRDRGIGVIPGSVELDMAGWELGDIARAGLVQLLALGVHDRLIRRFPSLRSIVIDGEGVLPPDVRLGLTLILGSDQVRVSSPMMAVADAGKPTESVTLFSEVSMTPFAWTLSFTGSGRPMIDRAADVSEWLALRSGEIAGTTPLVLPVGTISSALPGDFSFP